MTNTEPRHLTELALQSGVYMIEAYDHPDEPKERRVAVQARGPTGGWVGYGDGSGVECRFFAATDEEGAARVVATLRAGEAVLTALARRPGTAEDLAGATGLALPLVRDALAQPFVSTRVGRNEHGVYFVPPAR